MTNNNLVLKTLLTFLLFYAAQSFAMFCPENLKEIQTGDTIDHVMALCGKPDSQGTYADQVPYTDAENSQDDQTPTDDVAADEEEDEQKSVVITKFIYTHPHPAILIFEDGRLTSKYGSGSGAIFMYNKLNKLNKQSRLG